MIVAFNENDPERRMFYRALDTLIHISLAEDLEIADYQKNLKRMFGDKTIKNALATISGEVRFLGLTPTSLKLEGQDKHLKLIESYQKLQTAKRAYAQKTK